MLSAIAAHRALTNLPYLYLYDNPLLKEPLKLSHVKPLVVGHWVTTPGQNFIYVHLNRVIKKYDLDMFYIAVPGHGGPALVGNTYHEGDTRVLTTAAALRSKFVIRFRLVRVTRSRLHDQPQPPQLKSTH